MFWIWVLCRIYSPALGLSFSLLMVPSDELKFLISVKFNESHFPLCLVLFCPVQEICLLQGCSSSFPLRPSLLSLPRVHLTSTWSWFCAGVDGCAKAPDVSPHVDICWLSSYGKKQPFPTVRQCLLCHKSRRPVCVHLFLGSILLMGSEAAPPCASPGRGARECSSLVLYHEAHQQKCTRVHQHGHTSITCGNNPKPSRSRRDE